MPFATNHYYNVHWKQGIDFQNLFIAPSMLWDQNDGVVLRFNYTDVRQRFVVSPYYQKQLQEQMEGLPSVPNPSTCKNGEYHHDVPDEYLYICVSGRDKTTHEWTKINAIACEDECPEEQVPQGERQKTFRYWSDVENWPDSRLPEENENVTIPYEWKMIMDVDPPILNYVEVDGILIFDNEKDTKLQAHYIWVQSGIIQIGSKDNPYPHNANIILHGNK